MACTAPTVTIGGVVLSTNEFENASEILQISGDQGDPTLDEYEENIANGNNNQSRFGVQFPASVQTALPDPIPEKSVGENNTAPPVRGVTPVVCTAWTNSYDEQLSTNFKVRDFTVNAVFPFPLTDYDVTYTKDIRFCNLKGLAVNVAEALRAKFGPFNINSGIRNKTSTASGISQHITGQAMDVQFTGWSYSRYWDNAAWIKDNIPYDQFIFEHSSSTGLAWYHLSFNRAGNRAVTERTKVMTMYRNNYSPGLKRFD